MPPTSLRICRQFLNVQTTVLLRWTNTTPLKMLTNVKLDQRDENDFFRWGKVGMLAKPLLLLQEKITFQVTLFLCPDEFSHGSIPENVGRVFFPQILGIESGSDRRWADRILLEISDALATSIAAGITTESTVASGPSRKIHFPSFITATFDDRVAGGNLIYVRLLSRKIFTLMIISLKLNVRTF